MKIVLVECIGGLGNQMFQYVFYRHLKRRLPSHIVIFYAGEFHHYTTHGGYALHRAFGIRRNRLADLTVYLATRMLRRFAPQLRFLAEVLEPQEFSYHDIAPLVRQAKQPFVVVRGYWQCIDYQRGLNLPELFAFRALSADASKAMQEITSVPTLAIHVRGGDYFSSATNSAIFGGICDQVYYRKALEVAKANVSARQVLVFTNDVDYARRVLGNGHNFRYITGSDPVRSWEDMKLMSMCRQLIIANSSFSYWAAALQSDKDHLVVAPKRWVNYDGPKNLFLNAWILID